MAKILDVPFKFQKSENSCFPTCISMVLKYYGKNIRPELLYKEGRLPGNPYNWDAALAPFIIKKFIDNGRPVIATVRTDKFYKRGYYSTHLIVIVGYDSEGFYYHDPSPTSGGKWKKITYAHFKSSWWDLGDLSKRCMIIIMPKNGLFITNP
ncbi:MAG: C39 family peptidase [Candidatus Aenigmarchaeota archaeon]|nr:C39 family peptidase [Candidatus Aenigmarchaeota archaeon]